MARQPAIMIYEFDGPPWLKSFPLSEAVFPILPWVRHTAGIAADAYDEVGTCFFISVIDATGLFATAAHNIRRQASRWYRIMIPSKDGRTMVECQVGRRWFHPVADCAVGEVAISSISIERPSALPLDARPLRAEQAIASVGWPNPGREVRPAEGALPALSLSWRPACVVGTVNELLPNGFINKGYPVWSTTCPALGGHSGGPMFGEGGRGVRGILVEGDHGHGVFVDVQAVRDVLRNNGLRRRAPD